VGGEAGGGETRPFRGGKEGDDEEGKRWGIDVKEGEKSSMGLKEVC